MAKATTKKSVSSKAAANKVAKKATTKKAVVKKKATTKKAAPKKEAAPKVEGVSSNQVRILQVLVTGQPVSYNEIREATGIQRGLSKLVLTGEGSLVGSGFATEVEIEPAEGERQVKRFKITALGKKAIK